MDVGCYAVDVAQRILGEPNHVAAHALDTRDCGVDTELVAQLEYDEAYASLRSGFDTAYQDRYRVDAENGWIEAEPAFMAEPDESVSISYRIDGREATETFDPVPHYQLEIEAFADATVTGEIPISREETVGTMRIIDAIRRCSD